MFKIEIIGNIGADAIVKNENGNEFVSFSVAHTEKRNGVDTTIWVSATTPNKKLAQYLTKGTKVYLRGNASVHVFKNKEGVSVSGISLYATEIEFCGGGSKNEPSNTAENNPNFDNKSNGGISNENEPDCPF